MSRKVFLKLKNAPFSHSKNSVVPAISQKTFVIGDKRAYFTRNF